MAEPLAQDELLGISTAVESSFGTYPVLASSFTYFYCRSATLPAVNREKFDNTGFLGLQQEGPTIQRSGFVSPPPLSFSGDIDSGVFAKFARRMLGKADTPGTVVALESFTHTLAILGNRTGAGRQLPSSTFLISNGNLDYLFAGVVGNSLQVSQSNADVPQFTSEWVGGGGFKQISTIGGFGAGTPPADNTSAIMDGAETELNYTGASGTKYLAQANAASAQLLKSVSLTAISNANDTTDRRAGAKRLSSTDPSKGWVLSFLLHGTRTASGQFRVGVGASGTTADELLAALNDTIITDFQLRFQGSTFATFSSTPASRNRVEIQHPKCYFRNVARATDSGAEFLDVGVFPVSSGTSTDADFVDMVVTNSSATGIA